MTLTSTHLELTHKKIDACLEYLDQGWSLIPIGVRQKEPLVKWKALQERQPTEEEVTEWFTRWPLASIAVITGQISGVYVVDCDNETAIAEADELGWVSPITVKTKRGEHRYFRVPDDGIWRGPRSGINGGRTSEGKIFWPKIPGLDFRGDGGYALIPPSERYEWQFEEGAEFNELPLWEDYQAKESSIVTVSGLAFDEIDLTNVNIKEDIWELTKELACDYPQKKIPRGGSGIYDRTFRYLAQQVLVHGIGSELEQAGRMYMRTFYTAPLDEHKFQQNLKTIREKERLNHPERFNSKGEYTGHISTDGSHEADVPPDQKTSTFLTVDDADRLLEEADAQNFLIRPIIRHPSIVQVYGYSGHGKSLFVQNLLYHLALGIHFGPYHIEKPAKVLYHDWENGKGTIGASLLAMKSAYGNTTNYQVWAQFDNPDINLKTPEGIQRLAENIKQQTPDIIVIDTLRSAWLGMEEKEPTEWAAINHLALKLRNAGVSVILMHHANKPTESNRFGREAGSTNQLTVLETQIRITQVFREKADAEQNAGRWNDSYPVPPYEALERNLSKGARLLIVMEVRLGKVREWTDYHEREQFVGIAEKEDGKRSIVSSLPPDEIARRAYREGRTIEQISEYLKRPRRVIKGWVL